MILPREPVLVQAGKIVYTEWICEMRSERIVADAVFLRYRDWISMAQPSVSVRLCLISGRYFLMKYLLFIVLGILV